MLYITFLKRWLIHKEYNCLCSLVSDEELKTVLELPVLVVLDEAYVEFAREPSRIKWVPKYENLIVLRTFSKRAGKKLYMPRLCCSLSYCCWVGTWKRKLMLLVALWVEKCFANSLYKQEHLLFVVTSMLRVCSHSSEVFFSVGIES